jgi:hypothetical protein
VVVVVVLVVDVADAPLVDAPGFEVPLALAA